MNLDTQSLGILLFGKIPYWLLLTQLSLNCVCHWYDMGLCFQNTTGF